MQLPLTVYGHFLRNSPVLYVTTHWKYLEDIKLAFCVYLCMCFFPVLVFMNDHLALSGGGGHLECLDGGRGTCPLKTQSCSLSPAVCTEKRRWPSGTHLQSPRGQLHRE